jgi:hypothetical protein
MGGVAGERRREKHRGRCDSIVQSPGSGMRNAMRCDAMRSDVAVRLRLRKTLRRCGRQEQLWPSIRGSIRLGSFGRREVVCCDDS